MKRATVSHGISGDQFEGIGIGLFRIDAVN
jgi:hypothetical protein